jgi:GntR family transcriptional regulator/MocR family aminotransferase
MQRGHRVKEVDSVLILSNTTYQPLYLQLYEQIKQKIASGEMHSGSKLPSKHQLAKDLNVSKNTIETAYQQLLAEGYIKSVARRGFYVEQLEQYTFDGNKNALEDIPCPWASEESSQEPPRPFRYDFRNGQMADTQFPFIIWTKLLNQCLRMEQPGILSYQDLQGEVGLRREIMRYVLEYRGVNCRSEQIVIGAGTQHCLSMLCHLLNQHTKTIAVEEPGYNGTKAVFRNHGFNIIPITVDADGIRVHELTNSNTNIIYVTPSNQFPTGAIMSIARRLSLAEWAKKNNGIILEDDYCHLRYNIKPVPSLYSVCDAQNVVYLGTFSKILSPSLRLSYMILPPMLLDSYKKTFSEYNTSVPFLSQKALELFMQQGYWERHLRRTVQIYKKKQEFLIRNLINYFGKRIEIYGNNAGLHLLIKVKCGLTEQQLIDRAAQMEVKVYPVSRYWMRLENYSNDMVLLGFTGIAENDISRGVELLHRAWLGNSSH